MRLVDMYYPSGKKFREIYTINEKVNGSGERVSAWLSRGDYKKERPETIASARRPITDESIEWLKNKYNVHLAEFKRAHPAWVIDSPMEFQPWPGLSRDEIFFEFKLLPRRFVHVSNRWVKDVRYEGFSWDGFWSDERNYRKRLKALGMMQGVAKSDSWERQLEQPMKIPEGIAQPAKIQDASKPPVEIEEPEQEQPEPSKEPVQMSFLDLVTQSGWITNPDKPKS